MRSCDDLAHGLGRGFQPKALHQFYLLETPYLTESHTRSALLALKDITPPDARRPQVTIHRAIQKESECDQSRNEDSDSRKEEGAGHQLGATLRTPWT